MFWAIKQFFFFKLRLHKVGSQNVRELNYCSNQSQKDLQKIPKYLEIKQCTPNEAIDKRRNNKKY